MTQHEVVTVDHVSDEKLNSFLEEVFSPTKAAYLRDHGTWLHRSSENRWLIVIDGEIAAHASYIMTTSLVAGDLHSVRWLVDMVVHPNFRGMGLWKIIDEKLRGTPELKLGFPNEIAAKIHAKNGWGIRNDLRYMILPLRPLQLKRVQRTTGLTGLLLKLAASAFSVLAAVYRGWMRRKQPDRVFHLDNPDADTLAFAFEHRMSARPITTTHRDAAYIQWRYLDCPYRDELRFYAAGDQASPSLIAITRSMDTPRGKVIRLLDIYGDTQNQSTLNHILTLVVQDVIRENALEIHVITSLPEIIKALRAHGFILCVETLFCWHSTSPGTMNTYANMPGHWVFADSDNDEPVA